MLNSEDRGVRVIFFIEWRMWATEIYNSKLSHFGYEINVFNTWRVEWLRIQPQTEARLMHYGNILMNVNIFIMYIMYIVAENTGNLNILVLKSILRVVTFYHNCLEKND